MATIQMSFNMRMDKSNVVYWHDGMNAMRMNNLQPQATISVDLINITLNERTQAHKKVNSL